MGRLNEEFVRTEAIAYLKDFYASKFNPQNITVKREAQVKYKGKTGRADGLLSFLDISGKPVTVAIEAKSRKTYYGSIKPVYKDLQTLITLFAVLIAGFTLGMLLLSAMNAWLRILLSVGISALLLVIFSLWYFGTFRDTKHGVVKQLSYYPADFKWVAVSADLYNTYNRRNDERNEFIYHLKFKRMGLLVVSGRGKTRIELEPKPRIQKLHRNPIRYYKER